MALRLLTGDNGAMVEMTEQEFEAAVADALDQLPPEIIAELDNVVVMIEADAPPDDPTLLGRYDGVPLTERTSMFAGHLPDRITVYRNPTLGFCTSQEQVVEEVRITVVHEFGHYFGIDEARLHELGWG